MQLLGFVFVLAVEHFGGMRGFIKVVPLPTVKSAAVSPGYICLKVLK